MTDLARLPWLETARLRFRPLKPSDAGALSRIGGDPRVAPMIWPATVPWPRADALRLIQHEQAWRGTLGFRLAICLKAGTKGGPLIGTIGASAHADIYYFLDPALWRRGLVSEALQAFLPALRRQFGLSQVQAEVFQDNPASAQLLERHGFDRTGTAMGASRGRVDPAPVWQYRLTFSTTPGAPEDPT